MEKYEILQRSPLFEMLSPGELEFACELSRPRRYAKGEVMFEEGDLGDSLFVIAQGEVDVVRKNDRGEPTILGTLGPPEFFGEMSLIDKEFRSATVRAKSDSVLLQLTAENFATFRKRHKDGFTFIVMNIARVLSSRLRAANELVAQKK